MTEKLDVEKVRGTVSESWLLGTRNGGGTGPPSKKKLYPMLMKALYALWSRAWAIRHA